MPTGFQKFANKALKEEPISINPAQPTDTPETKEVKKFEQVGKIGVESRGVERRSSVKEKETIDIEGEARVETKPAEVATESSTKQEEKLFQITIKIKPQTKDKLDWLKFSQKKKFMELAEEAFEDIYKKYGGK